MLSAYWQLYLRCLGEYVTHTRPSHEPRTGIEFAGLISAVSSASTSGQQAARRISSGCLKKRVDKNVRLRE